MDLDADKITNNPEEAIRQALLLQQMQKEVQPDPQTAVGQDPMGTGGGNIGVGQAPAPDEQGAPTGGGEQTQQQPLPPEIEQALQQVGG